MSDCGCRVHALAFLICTSEHGWQIPVLTNSLMLAVFGDVIVCIERPLLLPGNLEMASLSLGVQKNYFFESLRTGIYHQAQ